MEKMTKRDFYIAIKEVLDADIHSELVEFVDNQIAVLDSRTEKAKERREAKKVEGDALRDLIHNLLNPEHQTVNDIVAQISDEEVTNAKVVARLTQLVKLGFATKTDVKSGDRTVKGYARVTETVSE